MGRAMGILLFFVLGWALFFGSHFYSAFRTRGAGDIRKKATGPYMAVYSLVSIAGLAMLIYGYGVLRNAIPVWDPPAWTRHVAMTLMLPAMILLVAAYAPAGHIRKAVKHPMLAAVKAWAVAHLAANGDLFSIILFGSFLVFGVVDRIAVKKRGDNGPAGAPSVAGDAIAVVVGIAVFGVLLAWGHTWITGVPLLSPG